MFPFGHVGFTLAVHEAVHRHPRLRDVPRLPVVWLAVGAMLPDILDKPVGHAILDWGTGRLMGHSLLFALVLAAAAWLLMRRGHRAAPVVGALAAGALSHLVLDRMWTLPDVLLWPLLGEFPHGHFHPSGWVTMLLTDPFIQGTELLGAVALSWVAASERRRRRGAPAAAAQ